MYLRFLGQTPSNPILVPLATQERLRAATEAAYFALSPADRPNWQSILEIPPPVIAGAWFKDPDTGTWYRGNGPFNVAYETLPPVIGGTPGTWVTGTPMSEAEAAAWIARVTASRQPLYGSPLTLPSRLGWTDTEVAAEDIWNLATQLGWPNETTKRFLDSFPTKQDWINWFTAASAHPEMWQQKVDELGLFPVAVYSPPGAEAPYTTEPVSTYKPPAGGEAPYTTEPVSTYKPPPGYAPHAGTPLLRARGWQPDEIGFWLTQAFGGDLALTEAFLLSFSGREELGAWVQPGGTHGAEDVYARAHAALAARRGAPGAGALPPATTEPVMGGGGISLPFLALAGAALFYFTRK